MNEPPVTGQEVMKPRIIARCIMNQNPTGSVSSLYPRPARKMANWATAMKPYMPTCQAVSESVSAVMAAKIPVQGKGRASGLS
jgi:hypothetical protein